MATKFSLAFLATIVIAATIQISAAQTTHTVGGTTGWTIPPGGASVYSTWASNQTFSVGDILVFNFANNQHDVTKVNKADYDACTTTNAITRLTTSPASITINGSGEHYFICGVPGHCTAGQKLMINVTSDSTSAPTPAPATTPAPQPSAVPVPAPAPQAATPSPTPISAPSPAPVSSSPDSAPSPATTPASTPIGTPSSPSPSSPSPAGSTAPPSPDSSATNLGVAGLSATFLPVIVALLF